MNLNAEITELQILFQSLSFHRVENEQIILTIIAKLEELRLADVKKPEPQSIAAPDFLRAGLRHMEDRAAQHDAPAGERSMGKTVAAFNIFTGHSITEEQGWLFMGCLKKARSQQGGYNADNYEDDSAYSALRGETALRDRTK